MEKLRDIREFILNLRKNTIIMQKTHLHVRLH